METDMLGGVQMGYRTVLVLSGATRREDLQRQAFQPDLVVDSITELRGPREQWEQLRPPGNRDDESVDIWQWRQPIQA